jgi:putative PIG3 family NAD(P)H quinone oxidoreductase
MPFMKAVIIKEFGGAENLEVREVPDPQKPTGRQVLVRVKAAGLNRADIMQRLGKYPPPPGYSENIPGLEFAGEAAETGDDVSRFKKGDRVFGIAAGEAQAEYLLADERVLARIPDKLSFPEAAAVPEVFITAHDAVFSQGKLRSGEWLLIHAVGSGVGLAALQLAKAKGAFVAGTSRTQDKLDRCIEFGLDLPLLTREPDFADAVKEKSGAGANVILDLVGGSYFPENLRSLALKGRLLLVGLTAGRKSEIDLSMALYKRATIIGTTLRMRSVEEKAAATTAFENEVIPLFESGRIKPNVDRVFAASEIEAAHRYLESNESFGKVVIEF